MSQARRQATLFQAWGQKKAKKRPFNAGEVVVIGDDDIASAPNDEDALLAKVMEESLKEYNRHQEERRRRDAASDDDIPWTSTPVQELGTCGFETLPGFDEFAGQQWIYPTNLPNREYQFSIAKAALFNNTMVILPTGLGKTFIAAVVMYNFYRWYPQGKIVFMAPTKPLVAQQIEACLKIMGICREDTAEMTGTTSPTEREGNWKEKRVFFLTPQVMTNDLSRGICPTTQVKLMVIDEAHKAQGNYAYCQVVREVAKYTQQFRVLALSATPGSDAEAIQQVLQNLLISHIELRTEECPDIQPYTFKRNVEKVVVPLGEELKNLASKFLLIIECYTNRLKQRNVWHGSTTATKYQLLLAREEFRKNPPFNLTKDKFSYVEADFAMAMSLCHAAELLNQHGMRSFYHFLKDTIDGEKSNPKARAELLRCELFIEIMDALRERFGATLDKSTASDPGLEPSQYPMGHPKLEKLLEIVLQHFRKHASFDDPELCNTRVMIFSQYRDSVNEITSMLKRQRPTVRVMSFTGQQTTNKRSKGMTQKDQIKVVKEFREGGYNTLVSTCVGEEGLDIGDIDLIICYDAHKSPVRLVQRMGRTGRKREGRIVMLVTKGKEEQTYNQGQYKKKNIQKVIQQFLDPRHLYAANPRMVPQGLEPVCFKMYMTIDDNDSNSRRKKRATASATEPKRTIHKYFDKQKSKTSSSSVQGEDVAILSDVEACITETEEQAILISEHHELSHLNRDNIPDGAYVSKRRHNRKDSAKSKSRKKVPPKSTTITKVPKQICIVETDSDDDAELLVHPFHRNVTKDCSESLAKTATINQADKMGVQEEVKNDNNFSMTWDAENDNKTDEHFFDLSPVLVISDKESDGVENDSGCWVRTPPTSLDEFDPSQDEVGSLNVQEVIRLAKGRTTALPKTSPYVKKCGNQGDTDCFPHSPKKLVVGSPLGFDSVFDSVFPNDDDFMHAVKQWESKEVYTEKPKPMLCETKTIFEPESMVFQPVWANLNIDKVQMAENAQFKNSMPELPIRRKPSSFSHRDLLHEVASNAFEQQGNSRNLVTNMIEFTTLRNRDDCVGKEDSCLLQKNASVQPLSEKSLALAADNVLNNALGSADSLNSCSLLNEHSVSKSQILNRTSTDTKLNSSQNVSWNRVHTTPRDNSNRSHYNLTQLVGMVHQNSITDHSDLKTELPQSCRKKMEVAESLCIPESPVRGTRFLPSEEKIAAKRKEHCNIDTKFSIMLDLSDEEDNGKHETNTSFDLNATQSWKNEPLQVNCDLGIDSLFDDSSEEASGTHHTSILKKSVRHCSSTVPTVESNLSPFPFELPNGICSSTPLPSHKLQTKSSVSNCLSTPESDLRPVRRKRVRILTTPSPSSSKPSKKEVPQPKAAKRFRRRKKCLIDEFIDDEASESDASNVSSDESETLLDKYEESFVDDETAEESSMAGIYLRDIRSPVHANGRFKLQYQPKFRGNVFSQLPTSSMQSSRYEPDSFVVSNDDEVIAEDDLSPEPVPIGKQKKGRSRIVSLLSSSEEEAEVEVEIPFAAPNSSVTQSPVNISRLHESSKDLPLRTTTPVKMRLVDSVSEEVMSAGASNSGTILVASRTLNGCQELVSTLRFSHHINAIVRSFVGCDFIVSNRMAVERLLIPEISNTTNRARIIERVQTMMALFERSCIILEADRDRSFEKPRTKYLNTITGALLQLPIKILHSGSQEETANLLYELMVLERRKSFGIIMDTHLTTEEAQLCKFYLKIPDISYMTALNLCKKFSSPQEVINSSTKALEVKGSVNSSKANAIVSFLRKRFGN